MKNGKTDFDFADILPIESMDGNRIEIEATEPKIKDFIRAFGFLLFVTGALLAIASKGQGSDWAVVGMIIGGLLIFRTFRKDPSPSLIFIKGSREIRIRHGSAETILDLDPHPFEVHTLVSKGRKGLVIWIHGRYGKRRGAQILCKGFPLAEQVVAIAGFLEAFIHDRDEASTDYIPRIKVS